MYVFAYTLYTHSCNSALLPKIPLLGNYIYSIPGKLGIVDDTQQTGNPERAQVTITCEGGREKKIFENINFPESRKKTKPNQDKNKTQNWRRRKNSHSLTGF